MEEKLGRKVENSLGPLNGTIQTGVSLWAPFLLVFLRLSHLGDPFIGEFNRNIVRGALLLLGALDNLADTTTRGFSVTSATGLFPTRLGTPIATPARTSGW